MVIGVLRGHCEQQGNGFERCVPRYQGVAAESLPQGTSCLQDCDVEECTKHSKKRVHKRDDNGTTSGCDVRGSPWPRASRSQLLLGQRAAHDTRAAGVRKVQVVDARIESQRDALPDAQPPPRRCGERVVERASMREMDRGATAVRS
eukprot:7389887-Prymnesium_polylepis.2